MVLFYNAGSITPTLRRDGAEGEVSSRSARVEEGVFGLKASKRLDNVTICIDADAIDANPIYASWGGGTHIICLLTLQVASSYSSDGAICWVGFAMGSNVPRETSVRDLGQHVHGEISTTQYDNLN